MTRLPRWARGAARADEGPWRWAIVREVDGRPARESPMAGALEEAGFTFGPHGYLRRR